METMFDTLLQLPLFQGLAKEDFTNILEKVKLHFTKHKPGEVLLESGTPCRELMFVLKGRGTFVTLSSDGTYSFTEHFAAPYVIEPYSLFGMKTCYAATYRAKSEVHTVSVSKAFVMKQLFDYEIFRLNYLNIVSNRAQVFHGRMWSASGMGAETHIAAFILNHTERTAGEKVLKIKMEDLAPIINETRMTVSRALNSMQEKGWIELHRGEIVIPDISLLTI